LVNSILHLAADNHLTSVIYHGFMIAGVLAAVIYIILTAKHYTISIMRAMLALAIVAVPSFAFIYLGSWVESGFTSWGGRNIIYAVIPFFLMIWPAARLLKLDGWALSELFAPCLCIVLGISHFGCMFAGCCHGYRWEKGIYNHSLDYNTFPIQPVEALVALAIAAFIIVRQIRSHYTVKGDSYPLMMVIFGISYFLLQFARDNTKLFLGLSFLALYLVLIVVTGLSIVFSISAREKEKKRVKRKGK